MESTATAAPNRGVWDYGVEKGNAQLQGDKAQMEEVQQKVKERNLAALHEEGHLSKIS